MRSVILACLFAVGAWQTQAQTTTACIITGPCGNSGLVTGTLGTGWTNTADGIPFSVNTTYTVSSCSVSYDVGSGTFICYVLLDANSSGATVSGTLVANCSGSGTATGMTGGMTNTIAFTGCTVVTGHRYWVLWNTSSGTLGLSSTTLGNGSYEFGSTCCTIPGTLSGTFTSDGGNGAVWVTLASGGGSTNSLTAARGYIF